MSVRKRTWRDRKGRVQEKWMIHIKHHHPDGTVREIRRVSPVNTRRGAEAYEREFREQLLVGRLGKEDKESEQPITKTVPTLADFADEFLAFQASPAASRRGPNKPGELREKRRVLDNHLLPAFAGYRLDRIQARDIDRYVTRKQVNGLSSSTITNHLTVLKRMFNVAKRWDLLEKVPQIHTPKKPNRTDFLSVSEATVLLEHMPDGWRPVVLMGLRTGLRLGELRGLRWIDIDLINARIRVEQNITDAGVGTPKSGRGRTVPLAADILEVLRGLHHQKSKGLVFPRADGHPIGRTTMLRMLDRTAHKAELCSVRKTVNVHLLRHTFASHAVLAGVPIRVVQEWLGHSEITMTMRYAHLSPEGHHNLIERLVPDIGAEREEHMESTRFQSRSKTGS